MLRSAASKVMWVGRATVFLVGLAVILALVFGAASMAFAKDGDPWLLGRSNVATAITSLGGKLGVNGPMVRIINNNADKNDTALDLRVQSGEAPLRVNSTKKVANLNADRLDNREASSFANGVNGKATNADLLDNKGWQPEAWAAPAFFDVFGPSSAVGGASADAAECAGAANPWTNYGSDHTSAAFYKDQQGVVHLKGLVKGGVTGNPGGWGGCPIFFLPEGYRPAKSSNFSVVTSDTANPGRIEIKANGGVYCLNGGNEFISLDGITFREGQ